eukprot:Sdes_comp20238_c0_seq1m13634
MKFLVTHGEEASRAGVLSQMSNSSDIETPAFFLHCHRGAPPFLTPRNLQQSKHVKMLQTSVTSLVDPENAAEIFEKFQQGAKAFWGIQNYALFCCIRDIQDNSSTEDLNGSKYISLVTSNGRKKFTPAHYMKLIALVQPDIYTTLAENCPALAASCPHRVQQSVDRSLRFLDECLEYRESSPVKGALFGVVQGGALVEERVRSSRETSRRNVDGFMLEGFGCTESAKDRRFLLESCIQHLPAQKPRLAPGFQSYRDILAAVQLGVDIFDAAFPVVATTQGCALQGRFLAPSKPSSPDYLCLWDSLFETDFSPLDPNCRCFTCENHTRAYVHHLLLTHEMLAQVLLILHNLEIYGLFFETIRESIKKQKFSNFKQTFLSS